MYGSIFVGPIFSRVISFFFAECVMEVSVSDITSDAFVIPWALHGFFRDLDIFSVFSFETLVRKILSDLAIGSSELLFFWP